MKTTLSLAALALAGLLLAAPTAQAGALTLDGMHQGESLVQTVVAKKKMVVKKKKKKKVFAKKAKKKNKVMKRAKKKRLVKKK